MTERDLERVLAQSVQDVHLSDAARRHIRQATREKEANPVKMKKFVAIALAMVLALSATVAVAAELGMFDFLAVVAGVIVIVACIVLLSALVRWVLGDVPVTFGKIWETVMKAIVIPE